MCGVETEVTYFLFSDCLEVVLDADKLVCLQCECSFESRNSLLIAVSQVCCGCS